MADTVKDLAGDLKIEVVNISAIKEWDKNPRGIKDVDFARLVEKIKKRGKLFKPFLVNQDGIILGGNMRYKALKHMGYTGDVPITRYKTKNEKEMFEISLEDNERAGYYEEEATAEMAQAFDLDMEMFTVDTGSPRSLGLMFQSLSPDPNQDGAAEVNGEGLLDDSKTVQCPRCHFEFEPEQSAA